MCTGLEVALIAGTAVSAGSAISAGRKQEKMLDYQAAQARADAEADEKAAEIAAEKIREQSKKHAARARAAIAASGVNIDSESANLINKDIIERGEQDASIQILDSDDRAARLRNQANVLNMQGSQAKTAGYVSAIGSVADGYYGWKTA